MRSKFTPEQTARGILSTIARGDWSLAAARLSEVPAATRLKVARLVDAGLSSSERATWQNYYGYYSIGDRS